MRQQQVVKNNNGAGIMQIMSYLAELVNAGLENRTPDDLPENITINQLYEIAVRAQMQGILFLPLMKLDLPDKYNEKVKQIVINTTMKSLTQTGMAGEITEKFEQIGIRHQFLKGTVLKSVYKEPVLREMGDIDIMIYGEDIKRAESVVKEMGFELYKTAGHHTVYVKKPYLVLEIHWTLFDRQVDKNQYLYYKNSFKAKPVDNLRYTYEFEKENFYVYMISHMAKHFYETGCGIRNLADIYVYLEKYKAVMNNDSIAKELKKLGLTDFEEHMRRLAYIWLLNKECPPLYEDIFMYMLDCGIYGRGENGVWGQLAKEKAGIRGNADERNIKKMYRFPSRERMKEQYPWVEKSVLLLPAAWFLRMIKGMMRKEGISRYKTISNESSKQIEKMLNIYGALNLKFKK